ncbi:MAG: spermidine synthase [Planctomycetota bacterium]|jgi:spermidine synthase
MEQEGGRRVGAIGLGTGTVAAYGMPGDVYRFYEIDPEVVKIANDNFTFLANSKAEIELALGDARVSLQKEFESGGPQRFDVLIVDAFSGDAIPVHLLTREAFALYWNHLKHDGVLLIHTSNRYVQLAPVARALAYEAGFESVEVVFDEDEALEPGPADFNSDWVVITRDWDMLSLAAEYSGGSQTKGLDDPLAIWTDDHIHLLHAMELFDQLNEGR